MSICADQLLRDGILSRAVTDAAAIVDGWLDRRDHEHLREPMAMWPRVVLCEDIAYALLLARGYDESLLETACDGSPPDGCTLGDLDVELERTRGIDLPDFECRLGEPGDRIWIRDGRDAVTRLNEQHRELERLRADLARRMDGHDNLCDELANAAHEKAQDQAAEIERLRAELRERDQMVTVIREREADRTAEIIAWFVEREEPGFAHVMLPLAARIRSGAWRKGGRR